ncbi:MAG: LemA family protein [Clostridia bacterium]|nr:LemA family protein [Clostridia bacterium]
MTLGGWIALGIVGFIVLALIVWVIGSYNGLVRLRNNVEESFSAMDVYMKKRYDLIPNIVETVKGYAKHEKETLNAVIAARNSAIAAPDPKAKAKAENEISGALRQLFALAENYPDLKANTSFLDLQAQLQSIETEIANSRRYYNANVKEYNTKIEVFPSNIVAGWFNFKKRDLFEIENKKERENVKVEF